MSYHRWAWLLDNEPLDETMVEAEDLMPSLAVSLFGELGYPALFSLSEGIGFFAIGPGQGLLYYFDKKRDTAFLFPDSAD